MSCRTTVGCRLLDSVAGSRPVCQFLLPSLCALPSSSCHFPAYLSISPPSYCFLPSFPISPGWCIEHAGASDVAVSVGVKCRAVTRDVTRRDCMLNLGFWSEIRAGRVDEWCSLTWDYVAVNQMACRVSALVACRCVSCRVPFLAAHHACDMA